MSLIGKTDGFTPLEKAADFNRRSSPIEADKRSSLSGFTPLEKATDFSRWLSPYKADGGLMPPSARTVRERTSLTGFTLVEALLSVVIIAVGTIFILQAFGQELTAAGISRDNVKAALFLKEKMTEIEGEISSTGSLVNFSRGGRFSGAGEKDFSWTLSFLPSKLNEGLTEICLSCFWKSRGKTCLINLATFVRQTREE